MSKVTKAVLASAAARCAIGLNRATRALAFTEDRFAGEVNE